MSYPYRYCCKDFPERIMDMYKFIFVSGNCNLDIKPYTNGFYIGTLSKERKEYGYGAMLWDNGTVYIGEWKDGEEHGEEGIHIYPNGIVYLGRYAHGKEHGEGKKYEHHIGLEMHVIYSEGKLEKVLWASKSFTGDDGDYDKDTGTFEKKAGCGTIIFGLFIIWLIVKFIDWLLF